MKFTTLIVPRDYADQILLALVYFRESWERTGRAWDDGEQEVLPDLEHCDSAEEAWVAGRFIGLIEKEVREQVEQGPNFN